MAFRRGLTAGLLLILLLGQFGCASSSVARENPWEEYPPPGGWKGKGRYASGYWWMPSKVGLTEYGNRGVIFYAGVEKLSPVEPGPVVKEARPAPPPAISPEVPVERPKHPAKEPAPAAQKPEPPREKPGPPEVKVVERIVYKAVPVKKEVHANRYIFPTITFAEGSAEVGAATMQFDESASEIASAPIQIRQAAKLIRDSGSAKVLLEGHIDAAEETQYPDLGAKRAEAVKKALSGLGVDESVLEIRDYGASRPLSTSGTRVGSGINRRVSFVVVPRGQSLEPERLVQPPAPEPGPNIKIVEKVVEKKVAVPELVITDRIISPNIYFEYDKSRLTPQGLENTKKAGEVMMSMDDVDKVTIEGHCDWRGSHAYNDALSMRRSNAVMKKLIELGVPASMLEAVGYGERRPAVSNDTDLGMALNRRVEFKIEYR